LTFPETSIQFSNSLKRQVEAPRIVRKAPAQDVQCVLVDENILKLPQATHRGQIAAKKTFGSCLSFEKVLVAPGIEQGMDAKTE